MLSLCRTLLRDPIEAEDALQATFLSAFRSLGNGTVPREPGPWLAAIARNECWSRVRARMREPLAFDETEEVSGGVDPVVLAIRNEDVGAFWAAFSELPRPQQRAFLLREFHGLSYDQLALALGVSSAAVESLLFRARRGLRTALASLAALPFGLRDLLGRLGTGAAGTGVAVKAATATVGIGLVAASTTSLEAHHARSHPRARPAPHALVLPGVVAVAARARPASTATLDSAPAPRAVRPRSRAVPMVWHAVTHATHSDSVAPAPSAEAADSAPPVAENVAAVAPTREEAAAPAAEAGDQPGDHSSVSGGEVGGGAPPADAQNGGETQGDNSSPEG